MSLWLLKLKLNTFYQIKVCTSLVQLLDRHHRLPDSVWGEVVWVWPDVSRSFYKGRCMYTLCTHNRIHLHHLILRPAPQRLVLAVDRGCSPSKPTDQHPSHHLISWLVGCFGSLIFILVKLFCGTATFLSSMSAWTDREVSGYLDIHQLLQKCTSSWMKIFYSWKSNYDSVIIPDLELYNADLAYLLKKYDAYLTKAPGLLDFVLALAQLWPLTWGDFLWYEWLPFALKSINPIRAKKKKYLKHFYNVKVGWFRLEQHMLHLTTSCICPDRIIPVNFVCVRACLDCYWLTPRTFLVPNVISSSLYHSVWPPVACW